MSDENPGEDPTTGDPAIEPGAIPWYRSAVFVGACVTVITSVVGVFAPKLMHQAQRIDLGSVIYQIITFVAGLFIAYKRKASPLQPLTLTKAAAAAHPNNQPKPP